MKPSQIIPAPASSERDAKSARRLTERWLEGTPFSELVPDATPAEREALLADLRKQLFDDYTGQSNLWYCYHVCHRLNVLSDLNAGVSDEKPLARERMAVLDSLLKLQQPVPPDPEAASSDIPQDPRQYLQALRQLLEHHGFQLTPLPEAPADLDT